MEDIRCKRRGRKTATWRLRVRRTRPVPRSPRSPPPPGRCSVGRLGGRRVVSAVFPPRQGVSGLVLRLPRADPDSGSPDTTQINIPKAASLDNLRRWRESRGQETVRRVTAKGAVCFRVRLCPPNGRWGTRRHRTRVCGWTRMSRQRRVLLRAQLGGGGRDHVGGVSAWAACPCGRPRGPPGLVSCRLFNWTRVWLSEL